jgi:hypothetical protein
MLLAICLTGCVSQSAVLVNSDGKAVKCENWGFGIIGTPVAMAEQSKCIKKAKADGYTEPKK